MAIYFGGERHGLDVLNSCLDVAMPLDIYVSYHCTMVAIVENY